MATSLGERKLNSNLLNSTLKKTDIELYPEELGRFSVISRTLTEGILPLCRITAGECPSQLDKTGTTSPDQSRPESNYNESPETDSHC